MWKGGGNEMRKILASIMTIALVASTTIGATQAYYSDTETSTGNTFAAGTLDLNVDGKHQCSQIYRQ